jgi:hypothetical protein
MARYEAMKASGRESDGADEDAGERRRQEGAVLGPAAEAMRAIVG